MEIVVDNLTKSFGPNAVLKGVSLRIPAGQLAVIVGGSGSGKSVLLKHLVGLLKPDSGRVLIDGEDIVPKRERDMATLRQRFGMIFQGGGMLQSLTVGQNVGLPLVELCGFKPGDAMTMVREKLKVVGLEGREQQMPGTLSGGQRKRAAIARALCTKADCFLFDEPTAGLDPIMSENIDDVIAATNRTTGATTIVVTHDLISVFTLAQRVFMLFEGRIVFDGTVEEFRNSTNKQVREFLARDHPETTPVSVSSMQVPRLAPAALISSAVAATAAPASASPDDTDTNL